jgi:hypothetical protein
MTSGIVALGDEYVIAHTTLKRLVQRDRRAQEFLLDLAEPLEAGLQLKMMIAITFGDGGNDGDVITLGADVVRRRDDCDVDVFVLLVHSNGKKEGN